MGDCKKLYAKFHVNPFSGLQHFRRLNSSIIFPAEVVKDSETVFEIRKTQYAEFKWIRFVSGTEDIIKSPIRKNFLKLPSVATKVAVKSPKVSLTPSAMNKIRNACNRRRDLSMQMFCYKFTG